MAQSVYRSVCPFDCPDTCGLLVTVENGRVVKVSGDPEHPITRGLLCSKMQHYERTVHSSQRLTTPLLRSGPKGSGQFRPIGWDEAVQRICEQWQGLIAQHGGESILPYSYAGTMGLVQRNSGHPFFHRLGASRLARTICAPAKEASWQTVMGETPGLDPREMLQSDLVILWGINAAATSIHTLRDATRARQNGARLWSIDTYRTATCDAADETFLIRPGSDGALALALLQVIVAEQLHDQRFIAENLLGFDEFAATILPDCTPEQMGPICGLPAATIRRMAHAYAAAQGALIRLGSGLTRYANGAMNVRCITCLPAITGAWNRPGGGLLCGTSTGAAFPLSRITREEFSATPTRIVNMNRLGHALNHLDDPPIRSLYVYHSNPAAIAPDQNAVIRGLARDDLFTVVHERFMTDTARYADIVLPATSSLEHADLYRSYGGYQAQCCDAVVAPPGEAAANWDVFRRLAQGMGWHEPFFQQSTEALIEQLLAEPNSWRDAAATERLRRGEPVLLTPPSSPRGPWRTPSGRIEIRSSRDSEPLPRLLATHADGDGLPLRFQSAVTPHALNSSFYERNDLTAQQQRMLLLMHPQDAATRGLTDGQQVRAVNLQGEVRFTLQITERTPPGTVVTEGVWWQSLIDGAAGVNALTSQRLTDRAEGSTLYDVAVEVQGVL